MGESVSADWVPDVTREAMTALQTHAAKVGLPNTDESVFRAFLMGAARDRLGPTADFETEWLSRFDLWVRLSEAMTVFELKYYLLRHTVGPNGRPKYKGGAGPKNEDEFRKCLRKLRTAQLPAGVDRRLVLVYQREYPPKFKNSYHRSYGDLATGSDIGEVVGITVGKLEARVLRPARPWGPNPAVLADGCP
jgi:hypothetical protein